MPTSLDDLEGLMGGPDPEQDTSIFDVQMGVVPPGTYVKLEDVVVSSLTTFTGDTFFVQDSEGGPFDRPARLAKLSATITRVRGWTMQMRSSTTKYS